MIAPGQTKTQARADAVAVRDAANRRGAAAAGFVAGHLLEAIRPLRGIATVAGYLPIRSEIDPRPAMLALTGLGLAVCVPIIEAPRVPLAFHAWTPDAATVRGRFGVEVPVAGAAVRPDLLLVPMLAFDARGHRLGYGGGFYDRTIAALRALGPVRALGLAYAAQEVPALPDGAHDMRLDAVVTEAGIRWMQEEAG